jgi:membrane protein DedA with SNARE-associated domain
VLATAAAAVICGDAIGYLAGRRHARRRPATPQPSAGGHLASGKPRRYWTRLYGQVQRSIGTVHRPRAARLVARHGGRTVFLARWIVGARTLVPRLVGEGGTSAWRFARWSVPAGIAWSTSYVLAGYLGGSSLDNVSALMSKASLAIIALLFTVGGAAILLRRWGRRSQAVATTDSNGPKSTSNATPSTSTGSAPPPPASLPAAANWSPAPGTGHVESLTALVANSRRCPRGAAVAALADSRPAGLCAAKPFAGDSFRRIRNRVTTARAT